MEWMDLLSVLIRWLHIAAGVLWIGLLWWFNFVHTPFAGTMDGETRKKVIPELIPRSLYWFRWGAAYTWLTGVLLLGLVFYNGGLMFEQGIMWSVGSSIMLAVVFLIFPVYDMLAKSSLGKDIKVFGALSFVIVIAIVYLLIQFGNFSYRAYVIHTGAMFGTIMAANVWMRIWPGQRRVLDALKQGAAPDAAIVAQVGQRSRHNTYLSVPLVWAMINAHTAVPAANSWLYLIGSIVVGWVVVSLVYDKSARIKGW
jgi:uncharacterized membrane protein